MKRMRNFLIKRIFVVFCCTVLLSSNIFLAYETTVYASETEWDDALKAAIVIAGTVAGLFFVPEITLPVVIGALVDVGYNSVTIGKYFYENSDGTYTVSEDLVQAVIDAAEELEAQGFTDSNVESQSSGYLYNYKWTYTESYMHNNALENKQDSYRTTYNMTTEKIGRVAGYKNINTLTDSNGRSHLYFMCNASDKNQTINGFGNAVFLRNGEVTSSINSYNGSALYSRISYDGTQAGDIYSVSVSFGGNFPIFTDYQTMMKYIQTGQGYKDALNYRPTPIFRRHSSYIPTYSGGAVTVNRTVINNITNKITEVDSDETLTDDQKIEILQQYIRTGGVNPTPTPPPTPTDPDYDDNKDLPSGTDLTDTNSWLKKIYLKVCQIYAKMSDSAGQSISEVVESIENLEKMLKSYLSEITGDLDDIKGQLQNMTEDEFNEKSDSFLEDVTDSFSEISDVAKTKFPFSIPNDLRILISKMTPSSSEDEVAVYSVDTYGISLYSDEEHGGGGGSRPADGQFVSVEHGGGGGSRGSAEMKDGAPVFYLPIVIERYGIEEYIIVNMAPFEPVSKLSRTLFAIMFMLCLINLTFKTMGLWGDLVG